MEVTDVLRCPKTGNRLRFDDGDSVVRVAESDVTYPVVDGIIDFCPEKDDTVCAAYDAFASRYDWYITSSGVLMKICDRIFWGIGVNCKFSDTVLSYLPCEFDGVLLDVPVGTGVFTCSRYSRFPDATIIGVDYSMGMLRKAKERYEQEGLKNVCLVRADVANLPLRDGAVDIVLSMNGLHVFTDKQRAIAEMGRALRKKGTLIACGYVKGVKRLSDWFVQTFAVGKGYFNPPFLTLDDIGERLGEFRITHRGNVKSMVYFEAVKTATDLER